MKKKFWSSALYVLVVVVAFAVVIFFTLMLYAPKSKKTTYDHGAGITWIDELYGKMFVEEVDPIPLLLKYYPPGDLLEQGKTTDVFPGDLIIGDVTVEDGTELYDDDPFMQTCNLVHIYYGQYKVSAEEKSAYILHDIEFAQEVVSVLKKLEYSYKKYKITSYSEVLVAWETLEGGMVE